MSRCWSQSASQMLSTQCLSGRLHTEHQPTGSQQQAGWTPSYCWTLQHCYYVLALAESYKVRTFGINVRPLNCKKAWDCWFYEFIAAKFCQPCIMSQYQLPQFTFVWGWLMCVWKYGKYLSDTIVLCADIGTIKDQNCFIIILSLYNYLFDFHTWIYLRMTQNL